MNKTPGEKIQKVLAQKGVGSRRAIERMIVDGEITVNRQLAEIGQRVTAKDRIEVNGRLIKLYDEAAETRVLMYHKPPDEICTRSDPEGRKTVFEVLPSIKGGRWISIGRLDLTTSGLLLFTNNGELANRLMHPKAQIEREYLVRVRGEATPEMIKCLISGVEIDGEKMRFEEIVEGRSEGINHWYTVVVVEGKNRMVRKLWESQGLLVSRLKRVRFGPVFLDHKLRQGRFLEMKGAPLDKLMLAADHQKDVQA